MTFSRIKPAGWAFGERLTSGQMNALDTDHANAVDGVGGGTYAPSNPITINGSGLACNTFSTTGNCTFGNASGDEHEFNGEVTFNDLVQLPGTLNVTQIFVATLTVDSVFTCDATAAFNEPAAFNSTVTFADDVTFDDPVSFNDTTQLNASTAMNGVTTFNNVANFNATATHNAALAFGLGGKFRHRVSYGTNANVTLNHGQCTMFKMRAGVMSTGRTVTLPTSGNTDGDTYVFLNLDSNFQLSVSNGVGNFFLQNAADFPAGVMAVYDATSTRFDFFPFGIAIVT